MNIIPKPLKSCWYKRILTAVCLAAATAGCGPPQTDEATAPTHAEVMGALLDLYETIKAEDTVRFFSAEDPEKADFKFKGRPLSAFQVGMLPDAVKNGMDEGYFACAKFDLDNSTLALVTRGPGKYVSSALWLLLYDKPSQVITGSLKVAEYFGEGGTYVVRSARLYKTGNGWRADVRESSTEDHSIENPSDTTITTGITDCSVKIHPLPVDTLQLYNSGGYYLEPRVSVLKGVLKKEPFWGPPNYGEDTLTDKKEYAYILYSDEAIEITDAAKSARVTHRAEKMQVLLKTGLPEYEGRHVTITGRLFEAETGHHHTPILVDAIAVKAP